MDDNTAVYTLTVEDVQTIAKEHFDRCLTEKEMKIIKDQIGDYLVWWEAVYDCIDRAL